MEKVYEAANLPEAHLILQLLEQEGIPARVFNENAQGAVGELPFTHTYPQIWLVREADLCRAREVLTHYEGRQIDYGVTVCPHCDEENPANFELCWRCGDRL
ncbi:MAG: DUF2007 domain-containing protein [Gammaproteobacteria bacterium]|nr:DUF2007 domain-containing protein [Gammaproteobacteria bacterium]